MINNVTTNALISFIWSNPLIAAVLGAAVALIGREAIDWSRQPRFKIDFEEKEGRKPYIPDYNIPEMSIGGYSYRIKYLRLIIRNKGKKPAMDCEAKLELFIESEVNKVALHWSRRDPALYSEYGEGGMLLGVNNEKVFTPISLNINDNETVDVFQLPYSFSTMPDTDQTPRFSKVIESTSFRQLHLQAGTTYQCKVTIYSSNSNPEAFKFNTNWDGTLDGLNKAFTKQ